MPCNAQSGSALIWLAWIRIQIQMRQKWCSIRKKTRFHIFLNCWIRIGFGSSGKFMRIRDLTLELENYVRSGCWIKGTVSRVWRNPCCMQLNRPLTGLLPRRYHSRFFQMRLHFLIQTIDLPASLQRTGGFAVL